MDAAENNAATPDAGRSSVAGRPPAQWLMTGAVAALVLVTIGGFAVLASNWMSHQALSPQRALRLASSQYVAGNVIVAGELAAGVTLDAESEDDAAWLPLRDFLVGAGQFAKAEQMTSPRDRRVQATTALEPLTAAEKAGFPEGRYAEGYRLLGRIHHETGRHNEAIGHLQTAIDADLTLRSELLPLLSKSQSLATPAQTDAALSTIDDFLAEPSLDDQKRSQSQLGRIELLLQLGRYDDALTQMNETREIIADEMRAQTSWAISIHDRLVLRESESVLRQIIDAMTLPPGTWFIADVPLGQAGQLSPDQTEIAKSAIESLGVLQREAPPKIGAHARMLSARLNLLLDKTEVALSTFTQLRQQRPFADEGMQGGLSELQLLASQGRGVEAVQTARYLVREMGQSRHLNLSPDELKAIAGRVLQSLERLRAAGEFESAIETAIATTTILTPAIALQQRGIAFREWGESTQQLGRQPGGEMTREASALARERFRGAGDAFAKAADRLFTTDEYLPTLWNAIDAYQLGRHYGRSIELLEPYLRYEERPRTPRGLIAHGRALLAEGKTGAAIKSLESCILEFDRDPLRYDARLLAAQAAAESGDVGQAETWLRENLTDGKLSPQSPAWRDALFALSEILFAQAETAAIQAASLPPAERIAALRAVSPQLNEATRRLAEAQRRYWPSPRAQGIAHSLARAKRLAAELPLVEMELPDMTDSVRRDLRQRANNHRQDALDGYTELIEFLDEQRRDNDLSERQTALLRNALIGRADVLAELERYPESGEAYRDMALRYLNEPPCLEAMMGQSRVFRKLGRNREADLLVRQAGVILERIGDQWDGEFDTMTRYNRDEWTKYLQWMASRLELVNTN